MKVFFSKVYTNIGGDAFASRTGVVDRSGRLPARPGPAVRSRLSPAWVAVMLCAALLSGCGKLGAVGEGKQKVLFEVRSGQGSFGVSRALEKEKLIQDAGAFRMLLRFTGRSSDIKAGIYELHDGLSAREIADILTEGRVRMLTLTIPEGWNSKQIGDYLARKKLVADREEFLRLTEDREVLKRFRIAAKSTEGYLFPDTYSVPHGFPAARLQELMIKRFFEQLGKIGVSENIDRKELQRQVILASIVEREAARPEDRPMMAQVFLNRLEKGMKLESCATIQYLLPKPKERLFNKDLKIQSPYNTYLHAGLPPGPIANAGIAAIKATFTPKPGPYLFFVLKPDRSHHFSVSHSQHVAAKKRYLGN